MLSRVTHIVLILAVLALTIALVRVSKRNVELASHVEVDAGVAQHDDGNDDMRVFAAALGAFDDADLAGDVNRTVNGALTAAGRSTPSADVDGIRSNERGRRGDWNDDRASGGTDGRSDRPRGSMPRITDELAVRCLEVAAEVDADLAQRLSEARAKNPAEFERQMRSGGFGRRLFALAELKTHDPLLYRQKISELSQAVQIERKSKELRELRADPNASLADLESLETQLRTLLQIQLAMSIKARGELLCRFEERRAELEKQLISEAANFQTTIEARMKVLLDAAPVRDEPKHDQPVQPADAKPSATANPATQS